jgi:hypothetical protein
MKNKRETRHFKVKEFRVKRSADGAAELEGYSAVFDKPSENLGWGDFEIREYIAPGAFTNVLKTSDCRAVFNHDPNFILGRESAKTLELTEDETGLRSVIYLPDTQYARDLAVSVERGDVREQSFCFTVIRDRWEEDQENKIATRTILEIGELIDISPVTYPAYPDTDIAKRSFEEFQRTATGPEDEGATARQKRFELRNKEMKLRKYLCA